MAEKLRERTAMLGTLHVTIDRASLGSISGTDCDHHGEVGGGRGALPYHPRDYDQQRWEEVDNVITMLSEVSSALQDHHMFTV